MAHDPTFEVRVPRDDGITGTLMIGLSNLGMAAVTVCDHLVNHVESENIGHFTPTDFPGIAPFLDGEPRHHTRLYDLAGTELTVLLGELLVPAWAAGSFTDSILGWVETTDIEEIAVLHGVPYPHGPDEHAVFYVSTPTYRERRLTGTNIQPLAGGFLDGVVGEIVTRSLDDASPAVGVLVTPTHPPGPDLDASLLLLDAIEEIYDLDVGEEKLRQRAAELRQYYTELSDRIETLSAADRPLAGRDFPEDRMYM